MFSDFSSYVPGYTGFIPKLQSVVGETYGNATRKLLSRRAKLLRLSHSAFSLPEHRYHPSRSFRWPDKYHHPQLSQEDGNAIHEYLPMRPKRDGSARRLIYDGAPQTTCAIQSIEKVKASLKPPPKPSATSQLRRTKPTKSRSSTVPSLPPDKGVSKIIGTTISKTEKVQNLEEIPSLAAKRESLQKQQGKRIYRPGYGLLPNYTGYVPGHKFSFGKTWGASTRNSLEAGKRQPLLWTSPM
ncbi:ciliary microtubule inner protein 2B-like [Paroedura picta]|uniref:ciliary microtubule inner protein 2B-like n=1 Tax=Paroedura picta TaxID=143630 RepID=UPI00405608D7